MKWAVSVSGRVRKMRQKLPNTIETIFQALLAAIEDAGPVRGDWPNYGKLGPGRHHCHLRRGRPTYVAVWEEKGRAIRLVEVTYVGTHEGAPY